MGCTSNRVRFLCLGDTKKPEPKKSHSLLLFEQIVGLTYNPTQPHRTESHHHHSVQSFAADLRTQPRRIAQTFRIGVGLGFWFLPFTIQHPASAGELPNLRNAEIWESICSSMNSSQTIGICLNAAIRSAGASLWQLTKPPFSPDGGFLLS